MQLLIRFFSFILIILLIGLYFNKKDRSHQQQHITKQKVKHAKKMNLKNMSAKNQTQNIKKRRQPAGTKTHKQSREIIGQHKGPNKNTIPMNNKVNHKWKELYKKAFFQNLDKSNQVKDFKITQKRSLIKVKQGSGQYLEHVLISYTKPNGQPFSFEALIDSQTGSVVQSWNQTRYEIKKRYKIKNASQYNYQE